MIKTVQEMNVLAVKPNSNQTIKYMAILRRRQVLFNENIVKKNKMMMLLLKNV
jgi:hypothetical protein